MSEISDALTQVRDAAHIDQGALLAIKNQLEGEYQTMRTWPDSTTKNRVIRQVTTVISGYDNAQREALELRDMITGELDVILDGDVPALPTGDGDDWSVEEW